MAERRQDELVQIQVAADDTGRKPVPHESVPEARLELDEVRAKLEAAKGPQYWRCLEELADSEGFEELLQREFPRQASEWLGGDVSRRSFLKLMSASLALAG